jgi:hypothetical protein
MISLDSDPFDMVWFRQNVIFGSDRVRVNVNPENGKIKIARSDEFLFGKKLTKFNFWVISHDSDPFDMRWLRQNVTFRSDRVGVFVNQENGKIKIDLSDEFLFGKSRQNLVSI